METVFVVVWCWVAAEHRHVRGIRESLPPGERSFRRVNIESQEGGWVEDGGTNKYDYCLFSSVGKISMNPASPLLQSLLLPYGSTNASAPHSLSLSFIFFSSLYGL